MSPVWTCPSCGWRQPADRPRICGRMGEPCNGDRSWMPPPAESGAQGSERSDEGNLPPAEHPSPTDLAVSLEDVARIVFQAIGAAIAGQERVPDRTATAIHALYAEALAEAQAKVRVAYGFDRDAVFANIDRLEAALAASQEREGKMREAIEQAAAWFEEYADHHQAKGALDKASRNLERANFLRRARTALNTSGEKS